MTPVHIAWKSKELVSHLVMALGDCRNTGDVHSGADVAYWVLCQYY